ncbi:NAD(P)H-quinone oxidoreductase [Frondihabitans cladoniiphilus]|uniref:NAD(P)H-quinone oxidoreductase n=1 Tax=Frondihabitans cladoniiphilus TaxID=715785 RepID=A0ABP8W2D3_9MICO
MRAILRSEDGGPEVLTLGEAPRPTPSDGEVLVRVSAAGLNRADLNQREGHYPPPAGASEILGMEVSGLIEEVGPSVTGWKVGDEVCALLPGGGYAEFATVDAGLVLPKPNTVDLVDAAGLPEVAATVWSNVFLNAQLQPGETLLVHGGTSGIGTMAIQIARALGSPVVATAGSPEKVAFCESLGAVGVDYKEQDFVSVVREVTGGRGADVVLDLVGGDYLARNVEALATNGRIMVIANQSGGESTFALGKLMAKRGRIWGTTLRARPLPEKIEIVGGVREHVWPLIESGLVHPVIDRVYRLDEAGDAHRRMESSGHIGKLLLAL